MNKSLGTLKKVELKEYWKDEAKDFTPWLAEEENLKLLGEAINMDLELVGTEQSVGDFQVDILAKEIDSDQYVVIENQLTKTDHNHLGKLLTYAAGRSAKTVVWIAEELREEHRKALDWLNEKTTEIEFFGLEIKLRKIGDSKPAPEFNRVSEPNGWAKRINQESLKLTDTEILQEEFWQGLNEHMKSNKTSLRPRKPSPDGWQDFSVGKSGFCIRLTLGSQKKEISCALYVQKTESGFMSLKNEEEAIKKELGTELKWEELPNRKSSKIIQYHSADFQNKDNWPDLFAWFQERSESFYKAFSKRIKELDLSEEAA